MQNDSQKCKPLSYLLYRKTEIIEFLIALGAIVILINYALEVNFDNLLYLTLFLTTMFVSAIGSIFFIKRKPNTAVVRLLFDRDAIEVLETQPGGRIIRNTVNCPYYAAHIFLVLYSVEYYLFVNHIFVNNFQLAYGMIHPAGAIYATMSFMAVVYFISYFLPSLLNKISIPKFLKWSASFIAYIFTFVIGFIFLISLSSSNYGLMKNLIGIPALISLQVLIDALNMTGKPI